MSLLHDKGCLQTCLRIIHIGITTLLTKVLIYSFRLLSTDFYLLLTINVVDRHKKTFKVKCKDKCIVYNEHYITNKTMNIKACNYECKWL